MTEYVECLVGDLWPGDRVLIYGNVTVEVLAVDYLATGVRLTWRKYFAGGHLDGRYLLGEHRYLPRLVATHDTAPGSDPRAADRADATAQIGA